MDFIYIKNCFINLPPFIRGHFLFSKNIDLTKLKNILKI
ncbi:hypothetical protein ClosIBUN22A_CONTIG75g01720 [Clostridium sp. IBUN22A]|nr:hypothetical protein CBY_4039 [Clostridium butyricum 5521]KJZ85560.1 hypothetical protein ClosIBUN22A_CONTIG75g01720 [Clostridium sp. IBUN22A]